MKILLAPDKFKGTFSSGKVCELIEAGIREVIPDANIVSCPIADGGDGFADVLREQLGGEWVDCDVHDALGRPLQASYASCGDTAVMEMSEASGIRHIGEKERDIWRANTYGTGEMMRHAIDRSGAQRIIVGIGGSASNDAGCGMAAALGVKFFDAGGEQLEPVPEQLLKCASVDCSECTALPKILVACDVDNSLLGNAGAVRVYALQKGASEMDFEPLETMLQGIVKLTGGEDTASLPGAGAAGGLGFGLLQFCGARLVPGFDLIARETGLQEKIQASDVVITGEGKIDEQTLHGKGPGGVARMARDAGKKVAAFAGIVEDEPRRLFDCVYELHDAARPIEETIKQGESLLKAAAADFATVLQRR